MILDLLFPKACVVCGRLGNYLCLPCQQTLQPLTAHTCLYCGRASYLGLTHPVCKKKYGVDGLLVGFRYNNTMKQFIKAFKYRLAYDVIGELQPLIPEQLYKSLQMLSELSEKWILQPIPLHPARERFRGFNQSRLLATIFQPYLPNSTVGDFLIRMKNTLPQAQLLGHMEKKKNVVAAFSMQSSPHQETVLLIDDVITTGSTVKEACKTLKRNGVKRVFVLAIAKG